MVTLVTSTRVPGPAGRADGPAPPTGRETIGKTQRVSTLAMATFSNDELLHALGRMARSDFGDMPANLRKVSWDASEPGVRDLNVIGAYEFPERPGLPTLAILTSPSRCHTYLLAMPELAAAMSAATDDEKESPCP